VAVTPPAALRPGATRALAVATLAFLVTFVA
jgi:hypothetical protein